ncbi:MAG TPA: anhydro-N-acetylmuramic acid kinase [Saprospiraceae bacterium]|nr:anhydro-N-acetylmuramic acid kinase [Saprospiraceae bacterium]
MKNHIIQLNQIAKKRERVILGLMSGTSLDGLDLALCAFSGSGAKTRVRVIAFDTIPYEEDFRREIRKVFARKEIDFQHLVLLNVVIARQHGKLVNQFLKQRNIPATEVDLLASHGQTVYHAPRVFHGLAEYPNATLQIGDGDHLARITGIITISDFRQKHVAAGGEGAPLALYGDYFLFSKKGENRFLLNIGGIANFTYLPDNQDPAKAFATDTGPGNTLLDNYTRVTFGLPFDEDSRLAQNGVVDQALLAQCMAEPFFQKPLPKTIGPELFSLEWLQKAISAYPKGSPNPYNVLATLSYLTASTIAEAIGRVALNGHTKKGVYVSGGGAHNPLILKYLKQLLPHFPIKPMEAIGLSGDAKEAVLFASLANETIASRVGEGQYLGGIPLVGMGKISLPG